MIWIFEPKHLRKHVITITILNFEREMGRNEKQGEIHFVYKIQVKKMKKDMLCQNQQRKIGNEHKTK